MFFLIRIGEQPNAYLIFGSAEQYRYFQPDRRTLFVSSVELIFVSVISTFDSIHVWFFLIEIHYIAWIYIVGWNWRNTNPKLTSTWAARSISTLWRERCENQNENMRARISNRVNIARILSIPNVILSPQRLIQFTYFAYRPHCYTIFTCSFRTFSCAMPGQWILF